MKSGWSGWRTGKELLSSAQIIGTGQTYWNDHKYSDRLVLANSVEPDQLTILSNNTIQNLG